MSSIAAPLMTQAARGQTWPVVEVFGPTVQGEGPDAGLAVSFVRFGLCDFRCSWCDSMHAVDPVQVKANATQMAALEVVVALEAEPARRRSRHVVLSGGNPAMHDLTVLTDQLCQRGWRVHVETQGSIWRDWLGHVHRLIVSPKPPSSGMDSARHERQFASFMERASAVRPLVRGALKVAVFDDVDFDWAIAVGKRHATWPLYLSAGTTPIATMVERHHRGAGEFDVEARGMGVAFTTTAQMPLEDLVRSDYAMRWAWLADRVAQHGDERIRALPQLHVLAWGHERCR